MNGELLNKENFKSDEPIIEQFTAEIQAADKKSKTLTCIIVSNQTNRGRRKVDVAGIDTADYLKSPVVLAFHDDERVIARCLWLKQTEQGLVAKVEFRDSALANDIFDMYNKGFLTSWSISFLPITWEWEEENGIEIIHIKKALLLEFSAVSIPMDANAITLAIGQGIVRDNYLKQVFEHHLLQIQNQEIIGQIGQVRSLVQVLCLKIEGLQMSVHELKAENKENNSAATSIENPDLDKPVITQDIKPETLPATQPETHPETQSVNHAAVPAEGQPVESKPEIIDFATLLQKSDEIIKTHIDAIKGRL